MDRERLIDLALLGFGLALAGLTLVPAGDPVGLLPGVVDLGAPQAADVLRNLVLFAPFGFCLRLRRVGTTRAGLVSGAVSIAIELLQLVVAGRHSSPWDVLANAAGGWLGAMCVTSARHWLRPDRETPRRLVIGAGATCLLGLGLSGLLLTPSVPDQPLFAHWSPTLAHLEPYDGRLVGIRLDRLALPHGPIRQRGAVRAALAGDFELELEAIAGAPPDGQSSLFLITDLHRRELLLIGPDGQDLVVRYRDRASALGLEPRVLRLDAALADVEAGERIDLRIERGRRELCIELRGVRFCGLGVGPGRGWSFIAPPWALPRWAREALDLAWIACLFAPLGYAWRRGPLWGSLALAGLLLLFALPRWLPLPATSVGDLASAAAGLTLGLALRLGLRRRANARSDPEATLQ